MHFIEVRSFPRAYGWAKTSYFPRSTWCVKLVKGTGVEAESETIIIKSSVIFRDDVLVMQLIGCENA